MKFVVLNMWLIVMFKVNRIFGDVMYIVICDVRYNM